VSVLIRQAYHFMTDKRKSGISFCSSSSLADGILGSIRYESMFIFIDHLSRELPTTTYPHLPLHLPIHLPFPSKATVPVIFYQAPPKAAANAKYQVRLAPPSSHVPSKFCWLKNCQLVFGSIHARLPYRMLFQPPAMLEAG